MDYSYFIDSIILYFEDFMAGPMDAIIITKTPATKEPKNKLGEK